MKNIFTPRFISKLITCVLILTTLANTRVFGQQYQRVYANDAQKSDDEYLLLGLVKAGFVDNKDNAVDNNTSTFATLNSTTVNVLGLGVIGGKATIRLRFTGADKPLANTPLTIKLGIGGNLLSALSGVTIQAINGTGNSSGNGNEVGPVYSGATLVNLLSGKNQIEFTITPTQAYDGVKINLGIPAGLLNANVLSNVDVYHAYFLKPASSIVCENVIDSLYGSTGVLVGGLNPVDHADRAFDKDENTFTTLRTNVSALSSTFLTGVYPSLSKAGDSVRLILQAENTGLLDATVLSGTNITTYTDNTQKETFTLGAPLLNLKLLGGGGNKYVVTIPTTLAFNRLKISIGDGLVGALAGLKVYEMGRIAPNPIITNPELINGILTACQGAPITFTINPAEAGATYKWFDAPAGGSEITAGVSANGTIFSPSGLTTGTYDFYVALYRNGCTDAASGRSKVTIIITPSATAADINAPSVSTCIGSDALLPAPTLAGSSTITNPVFKWYFDINRTTPITNGTTAGVTYTVNPDGSLLVSGLTSTTNYYISVSGDAICENAPGALAVSTVTINNIIQPTIDLMGNQIVGTGGTITLTASSANATSYQWYKDNVLLPGETNSTLTISNAQNSDAGAYTVIAIAGTCSSVASVAVNVSIGGFGATKTVSGLNTNGKIDAGSELTYTITVNNSGTVDLNNVTVSDVIPTGTTYVAASADNGGVLTLNKLDWTIPTIAAGTSQAVTFKVTVASNLTGIPSIGNTAIVTDPNDPGNPQTPTVPPIPTEQMGSFNATKTLVAGLNGNGKIESGANLTYNIVISNTGNIDLTNVTISDLIPNGTSFVSADNGGSQTGGIVNWTANIPFGTSKTLELQLKVADNLTGITSITNAATVTDPQNPGTPQNPTTPPIPTDPIRSFTATKTLVSGLNGNGKISAGASLQYSILVTNTGTTDLTGVTIADAVPAGTSFVNADNGGIETNGVANWTIDIPFGGSKTVLLNVKVTDDLTGIASIANAATVTDPQNPGTPENPTTPPTPTDPVRSFTTTKTLVSGLNANSKISAGATLTYNITVNNTGTTKLTGITVADVLPAGTSFVSADNGGTEATGTVNWTIDVPFAGSTVLELKVKVADDLTGIASIANAATVTDPQNPGTPENPTTPPTPTDPVRSFTATKTLVSGLNGNGKISAGATLTYNITVNNTGTTKLTGITVADVLPAGTSFVSADNGGTEATGTVNWTIDVPFAGSTVLELKVKVADDLTGIASIANAATVTDPQNPGTPENPTTPPTPTDPVRSFTATKTLVSGLNGNGKISAGATLTYNITVNNTGTTKLTGITVADILPAGTSFVSADNGGTEATGTVNWTVDVPFAGSTVLELKVKVADDLTGIASIANAATVTDPQNPGTPENPTTPPTPTDPVRSFTATKTLVSGLNGNGKISAGATLTYNITVNNTGTTKLTGITVADVLPAGTSFVSADNGGTETTGKVDWTIDVPFAGSTVLELKVKVADDLTGIASIANAATVTDPQNPGTPENPTTPPTPTDPIYDFTVTSKITSNGVNQPKASPNDELTITIDIKNTGNTALNTVVITNPLPNNTTFVSANNGGVYDAGTNTITFNVASIPVNSTATVTFKAKADADLTTIATINSQSTVVANGQIKTSDASILVACPTTTVATVNVNGTSGGNLCVGSSNTVTITATSAGVVNPLYYLYKDATLESTNNTGIFTVAVVAGTTYNYSVGISGFALCETPAANRKAISFTANAIPLAPNVTAATVSTCEGTAATLAISNPVTGYIYNWYENAIGGTPAGSGTTFTSPVLTSNKSYFVEAISPSGCNSLSRTEVMVDILPAPAAPLNVSLTNGPVCNGTKAILSVDNPQSGLIYRWYLSLTGGVAVGEGNTFTSDNLTSTTTFYVESVRQATSCVSNTRTAITVDILPILATPVVSLETKTINSITFKWTPVSGAVSYEISLDGGISWTNVNSATNYLVAGLTPGQSATISVRAKGATECQDSATSAPFTETADNPFGNGVFIPNTFTPNGDGNNDQLYAYGNTISQITFKVFNQWGQLIFESKNLASGWDGTYKGQAQPTAVYVYIADITFQDGSKTIKKGTVALVR